MKNILAISIDLDDTLWPIWPVIEHAEQNLHQFLVKNTPKTALQFPIPAMRHLREHIAQAHPELAHDFTTQRKLSLRHAFQLSGESDDWVEPAFEAFFSARNQVTLFEDCIPALQRLASQFPLIAITNGNADLHRTGIAEFFIDCISAKNIGSAKPEVAIFEAASAKLNITAPNILHVGDDPWLDVQGAHNAGFQSAWINRTQAIWPEEIQVATYQINTLHNLVSLFNGESS
ncbi:MAG: HAD-IA family hydrolase [Arenimonas sp.]|nr:HAD-IA family hydrolase [Arenimonas sp.]MBP6309528.1 HAD-IA family hydrolase [Arenimonas sp.]